MYYDIQVVRAIPLKHELLKRSFDLSLSLVGIIIFFPVMLLAFLIASIETKSFGLFTQYRIGKDFTQFKIIKIKTMRKIPNYNNWKNAVCYDPTQFALGGLRDANVRAGDFVVVSSLGAIGQIAIQLAKKAGASVVIGVDPLENRRNIARKHGADYCFNPIECDIGYEVKSGCS